MSIFDFFRKQKPTAKIAKERLLISVAHQRNGRNSSKSEEPEYMEALKREILEVVRKYVHIEVEDIDAKIASEGDMDVLELNISLPEGARKSDALAPTAKKDTPHRPEIKKEAQKEPKKSGKRPA